MTIESLVEQYINLCRKHGCTNVKSIIPIEYRINYNQNHVVDGVAKMEVVTYGGKTVIIEHIAAFSYIDNLQTLKTL